MNFNEEKETPSLASYSVTELKEKCLNIKYLQHNLKITSVVTLVVVTIYIYLIVTTPRSKKKKIFLWLFSKIL